MLVESTNYFTKLSFLVILFNLLSYSTTFSQNFNDEVRLAKKLLKLESKKQKLINKHRKISLNKRVSKKNIKPEESKVTIDYSDNKIYLNSSDIKQISPKLLKKALKTKSINYSKLNYENGSKIKLKNGEDYTLILYSNNFIKHPIKTNQRRYGNNLFKSKVNKGKHYYEIKGNEGKVGDNISFEETDLSKKYIVFICNAKAKDFVKKSITGKPYLWGHQFGRFNKDDWPFMACDSGIFPDNTNEWNVIHGTHQLHNNVNGAYIMLSLGLRKGEEIGKASATMTDFNVRIFNTKEDAKYYIQNIFQRLD